MGRCTDRNIWTQATISKSQLLNCHSIKSLGERWSAPSFIECLPTVSQTTPLSLHCNTRGKAWVTLPASFFFPRNAGSKYRRKQHNHTSERIRKKGIWFWGELYKILYKINLKRLNTYSTCVWKWTQTKFNKNSFNSLWERGKAEFHINW